MARAVQVEFLLAGITDSSGEPLASGKVYTYEAGTSTNKTTHTDQGQTIEATNPIILGTRGEASIFAEGAYKFVIKDSADVPLVTIDGLQYVYPDNFNIYAGSSTGSANAYILSPSPAATAYVDGQTYTFIANFASTGAATLNVSGLGAKSFVRNDGTTALGVGDILVSTLVNAQYIAGSDHFRLVSGAGVLAIAGGGTGGATAADARTNLGLGTMAVQAASAVAITGGTIAGAAITTSTFGGTVAVTGGTVTGITDLAVADGGTGSSNAADARTALGLGTMATQASGAVAITGGTITGITDLAVADGGTGASNAANARANLSAAVTGANGDITSLTACTIVGNATTALDFKSASGYSITFYEGASIKCQVPTGTVVGSAGFIPWTDNWFTLGSPTNCWKTVYTVGVLGLAGNHLTIASETGQDIILKAGNSTAWWRFSSAGQLVWAAAPDYTVDGAYVPTRSLNPAVATAANCANAINTIWADLIAAGIFQ